MPSLGDIINSYTAKLDRWKQMFLIRKTAKQLASIRFVNNSVKPAPKATHWLIKKHSLTVSNIGPITIFSHLLQTNHCSFRNETRDFADRNKHIAQRPKDQILTQNVRKLLWNSTCNNNPLRAFVAPSGEWLLGLKAGLWRRLFGSLLPPC